METCRFVEITDKELIEFVEDNENPNTKGKTPYEVYSYSEEFHSDTKLWFAWFISFHHTFWETAFRNSSLISFRKKDGSD